MKLNSHDYTPAPLFVSSLIVLLLATVSCSGNSERMLVRENTHQDFRSLLFFSAYTELYGIDPETRKTAVLLSFPEPVSYGGVTENGELICMTNFREENRRQAYCYKINGNGRIVKISETLPNAFTAKMIGAAFILDSAAFDSDGWASLSLRDTDTLKETARLDRIPNWIVTQGNATYRDRALLAIAPNRGTGRGGLFIDWNPATGAWIERTDFLQNNPDEMYSALICGEKMLISRMESHTVERVDIESGKLEDSVSVEDFFPDLFTGEDTLWDYKMFLTEDFAAVIFHTLNEQSAQGMLVFDKNTLDLLAIHPLNNMENLRNFNSVGSYRNEIWLQFRTAILILDAGTGKAVNRLYLDYDN